MAPSKADRRVFVSTIFKKHQTYHKEGRVSKLGKNSKPAPTIIPKRHTAYPPHSLAKEFSDKIALSRTEILTSSTAALESTHHQLLNRLSSASAQATTSFEDAKLEAEELTRPLDEERLQFLGKNGRPVGIVLLGGRMGRLQEHLTKVEQELKGLWREWEGVVEDIGAVGRDLLGRETLERILRGEEIDIVGDRKGIEVIKEGKDRVVQEIGRVCNETMQKMMVREKEIEVMNQKKKQEFWAVLGVE